MDNHTMQLFIQECKKVLKRCIHFHDIDNFIIDLLGPLRSALIQLILMFSMAKANIKF